jgi:hypothetical protein
LGAAPKVEGMTHTFKWAGRGSNPPDGIDSVFVFFWFIFLSLGTMEARQLRAERKKLLWALVATPRILGLHSEKFRYEQNKPS